MKKVNVLLLLATGMLFACNEEKVSVKDAEYYSTHVDELIPLYKECKEKIDTAETMDAVELLFDDTHCQMIYLANGAVDLGSVEKAKLREAQKVSFWEGAVKGKWYKVRQWDGFGAK